MIVMNGEVITKQRFPSPNPNVKLFQITYLSQGLKVKGLLAEPITDQKLPGLLYLRGGIKNVGKVRPARVTQFASEGFVVFAPYYRGNQGGEGFEDFGGDDRYDAVNGLSVLDKHSKVNNHLHVFGFSRGGVMALWVGILEKKVSSIVTWGGVSDMVLTYEERVDMRRMMKRVIGGTPSKVPMEYMNRTPLNEIDKIGAPVLIIHGEQDQNVSVEHGYRLSKELEKQGKPVECWIYKEFTHYFPPKMNQEIVHNLTGWMKSKES